MKKKKNGKKLKGHFCNLGSGYGSFILSSVMKLSRIATIIIGVDFICTLRSRFLHKFRTIELRVYYLYLSLISPFLIRVDVPDHNQHRKI